MPSLRETFVAFLRFLAGTNLFIAAAAGVSAAAILPYFGRPADRHLAYFVFFGTLFAYNAQRRLGDLHGLHDFSKTEWTLMAFAVAGMSFGVWSLPPLEVFVLGLSGALSIAYAYPVVRRGGAWVPLRRLPYVKLWLIVVVWLLSCVVAPLLHVHFGYFAHRPLLWTLVIVQQGAFVAALTVPFDIRDMATDFPDQRTVPQRLGATKAKRFALVMLLLSAITSVLLSLRGPVTYAHVLSHMFVCVLAALLVVRSHAHRDELYFYILLDGMILLQGLLFLWVSE